MSQWACNDGMSDDELSPTTVVINSPPSSPPPAAPPAPRALQGIQTNAPSNIPVPVMDNCSLSPSPTRSDNFYTDGCGDRPYIQGTRQRISRARIPSPSPIVTEGTNTDDIDDVSFSYAKHDNSYYKGPKITINYTSKLESVTKSADTYIGREFISSSDVFSHISLGGKLPRELMRILDNNISNKICESYSGNDNELREFLDVYCIQEGTSLSYRTNMVASPYKGSMFLTRCYYIILGECTEAFLKYNDQVIY